MTTSRAVREPLPIAALLSALALAVALAVAGATSQASSPDARAQHEKDVRLACAAASELKDPLVHPATVLFDDTVGMDARLVTGTWRPAHMKGAKALMLCLFDRKTRRAVAQDAEVWRGSLAAPTARPASPSPLPVPVPVPAPARPSAKP
jgi:hypothetical protein